MKSIYVVMYQMDDTHEIVEGAFSSLEKAEEYRKFKVKEYFGELAETLDYYLWVDKWDLDKPYL